MAAANLPPGAMPVDENRSMSDPFLAPPEQSERQRYSGFDSQHHSLYNASPAHAKRALEAYLAETTRRMNEAGNLGTALMNQQTELQNRIRDVDSQQQQDEITPELKARLSELEREVNELSRETARTLIPVTPRREDNESSELFGRANQSPSKVQAPSRKQRNQQPNRVADLKFATDISQSLVVQVRDLQTALAEKESALRDFTAERSDLDAQMVSMNQLLRAANEANERSTQATWDMEVKNQDLEAAHKDLMDREQRLAHNFKSTSTAKAAIEREFEDLKQAHEKLSEDHSAAKKQYDYEIESIKRDKAEIEKDRDMFEAKSNNLLEQNTDLAQYVSQLNRAGSRNVSGESAHTGDIPEDTNTPDESPPGSPSKATPRHTALQGETQDQVITHLRRTVQNLKNQLHREKTEKMDYRRVLQEKEQERGQGVDSGKKRKSGKDQDSLFKKPARPDRLGASREGRDEIIMDDPDWEDHDGMESPTRGRAFGTVRGTSGPSMAETGTDAYVTATENSDHFETANERETSGVETDAFQTGAETLDGDTGDDSTEKEDGPMTMPGGNRNRLSFHSTASTSGDDEDDIHTPIQTQQSKFPIKIGRGRRRVSGQPSISALNKSVDFRDSPAGDSPASIASPSSVTSSSSTPVATGQSLFAELENLSDGETDEGTPKSSGSMLSPRESPEFMRKSPAPSRLRNSESSEEEKPAMVEAGCMTEPWEPKSVVTTATEAIGAAVAGGLGFGLGRRSKNSETDDKEVSEPTMVEPASEMPPPEAPKLSISSMVFHNTEPIEPAVPGVLLPLLQTSSILSQHVEPVESPKKVAPTLQTSSILSQHVEPVDSPVANSVASTSALLSQHTEPQEPEQVVPVPDPIALLEFSSVIKQETEPVDPPGSSTAIQTGVAVSTQADAVPTSETPQPAESGIGFFGSMFKRAKSPSDTTIAEDETSSPPKDPIKQESISPDSSKSTLR